MTTEIIEGQVVGREIVQAQPMALFGTTEPTEIVAKAEAIANVLMQKVRTHTDQKGKRDLVADIQGKEHICVGGWTLLGSLVGVFPVCVWTRPVEGAPGPQGQPHGWEARVEAHTLAGQVVGAAEALCTRSETMWAKRDDYALRSMAQTRATSKALRMPLGFIASLAGFEATPAEEMPPPQRRTTRQLEGPVPNCPDGHGPCGFVPAGTSKAGRAYESFWGCPEKRCTAGYQGKPWSIKASEWDATQEADKQPPKANEGLDDGLPFEE